jgi:hypothetical protein
MSSAITSWKLKRIRTVWAAVAKSAQEKAENPGFDEGQIPALSRQAVQERNSKESSDLRLVILDHP